MKFDGVSVTEFNDCSERIIAVWSNIHGYIRIKQQSFEVTHSEKSLTT